MTPTTTSNTAERRYSASEISADRWVHRIGITTGLVAAVALIRTLAGRHDPSRLVAGLIYAGGLMAMLGFSAAYHLTPPSRRKVLFRRLDHVAIFIMIAGTYTPFLTALPQSARRTGLLIGIWLAASFGSALKLLFPDRFERLAVILYLLMGWVPLLVLAPFFESAVPSIVALLATGGVLYTGGVVFHLWEALPYHKAIWHGMVLAAASTHYCAILFGVAWAATG